MERKPTLTDASDILNIQLLPQPTSTEIRLSEQWSTVGATRARGHAFLDGRWYPAPELARLLNEAGDAEGWLEGVRRLNGSFALVMQSKERVLAAVDRLRSIPLFYVLIGGRLHVSDDAVVLSQAAGETAIDQLAAIEFRLTGYVTGTDTLCPAVKQLRAGEWLRFDAAAGSPPECRPYYQYRHKNFFEGGPDELISALEEVHHHVFDRLIRGAEGRTLVVPMSGGYDSRLIGVSLRDAGVRDVICYSYGVPGNWESRISQELARYLGYRWLFTPYSAERWRAWAATDEFHEYCRAAGNLTSVPHVQDWPAVREMKARGEIPPDGVFVPGHSGDFLAGSHIPKWFIARGAISRRELLDAIEGSHYSLWDWPKDVPTLRGQIDRRIESVTGPIPNCNPEQAADLYEIWDLEERQAKFICNSLRVYEFFDHEWRLPLFDHELMDFWARAPLRLRHRRTLYFEFVRRRQQLPISQPNSDRHPAVDALLRSVENTRLWPLAKRGQRLMKRIRWRREYEHCPYPPFAWYAVIPRKHFRATYTGKELFHSYLAERYLNGIRTGSETGKRLIEEIQTDN